MRRVSLATTLLFVIGCGSSTAHVASGRDVRGPWAERTDIPRIAVPIDGAPGRGADHPLVTMVVFSDYQCPYCRDAEPTLARVLADYPDTVRLHFRNLPLPSHEHAELAAEAAEEARAQGGDRAFWAYHDLLFAGALELDDLVGYAQRIELDPARFRVALRGRVHREAVEQDVAFAEELGVGGTPTLFVNGRPLLGVPPYDELRAILDEELGLAREALARGIARDELYERVLAESSREAPAEPEPEREEEDAPRRELDERVLYSVPVDDAPSLGPADAPVTIIAFSDFQCPFCARAVPTLQALRERYPERIRLVFRHHPLPFHRNAARAALTAEAAREQRGDAGFWAMHDRLFANQDALEAEDLERHAVDAGLDLDRFRASVRSEAVIARIERDERLARQLGVLGTPIFYVNGRVMQGAQPLAVFAAAVDDALARAQAELDRGTAPSAVYEALIREGSDHAVWREPDAEPSDEDQRADIAVPPDAPRRGASRPQLVIQVFSDFECPFCGRVQPTLERLLREHPEVQLVFRHFPLPFHRDARPAAIAAIEVHRQLGDAGFWAFHDLLFENQGALAREDLLEYARQVGANPERVGSAIDSERHARIIDADVSAIARSGLRDFGTPAFLIGQRLLMGAQPYEAFDRAVREALSASPTGAAHP